MERLRVIEEGQEHILNISTRVVTVGRSSKNDIVLKDRNSSRKHCNVLRVGDSWFVVDCDSQNGTFVNDESIKKKELKDGDKISIGAVEIFFLIADTNTAKANIESNTDSEKPEDLDEDAIDAKLKEALEHEIFNEEDDDDPARANSEEEMQAMLNARAKTNIMPQMDRKARNALKKEKQISKAENIDNDKQQQKQQNESANVPVELKMAEVEPISNKKMDDKADKKKIVAGSPKVISANNQSPKDRPSQDPQLKNIKKQGLERIKKCYQDFQNQMALKVSGQEKLTKLFFIAVLASGHCLLKGRIGETKYELAKHMTRTLGLSFRPIFADFSGQAKKCQKYNVVLIEDLSQESIALERLVLENIAIRTVADPMPGLVTEPHLILIGDTNEKKYSRTLQSLLMFHLQVKVPTLEQQISIIEQALRKKPMSKAVTSADEIKAFQNMLLEIKIPQDVLSYITRLISFTNPNSAKSPEIVNERVEYGASWEDGILVAKASRALAAIHARNEVQKKDVNTIARYMLPEKIKLTPQAENCGLDEQTVFNTVLRILKQKTCNAGQS